MSNLQYTESRYEYNEPDLFIINKNNNTYISIHEFN